jgi:hypothetical protein
MEYYVGLDVSLKQTSICVVNQTGSIMQEGVVDSIPEAIAAFVRSKAPGTVRIGIETGTDDYVVMDRAQPTWPAGDLHRCAPCQGSA